jgi:putative DNA primase/helicase
MTETPDYVTEEEEASVTASLLAAGRSAPSGSFDGGSDGQKWPNPKPLPDGLLPVASFDTAFLPESIAPWVADIADRMQCPPDFVAVPAMVALGSVLGRKVAIRPQRLDDWTVVPNLWGCIAGRPGMMKSPAMGEALKPLHRLDGLSRDEHAEALKAHSRKVDLHKLAMEEAKTAARKALRAGQTPSLDIHELDEPKARRFVVNDTTYEALGEILADNPNGVLAFRDELISLLKTLDREEYCAARGFFLTAWDGTQGYIFDRILRGKTNIDAACLSLLGSTQPGRLAEYIRRANTGGAGDDGLIQRFGLLVCPDRSGDWKECDRYPNSEARTRAWETFNRLDKLDPDAVGSERDQFETLPFLRFDDEAQGLFREWRSKLEKVLRNAEISPALESHLAKYRKLVPALALINHVADGGAGRIDERALMRALAFAEYLETHARRAYGAGAASEAAVAKLILAHVRKGDLSDEFAARDIRRKEWSGLTDNDQIKAALELLTDFDWIAPDTIQTAGRPRTVYRINPRALQ